MAALFVVHVSEMMCIPGSAYAQSHAAEDQFSMI